MPQKKWSRQEEEKKLKDCMTKIQKSCSHIAKLSKEREDALQAAVPGIHRQQENDVLQSAEDWCKFYEDDTAWLQQKASLEAQQLLETNEALDKLEHEHAALRVQLDELKLIKDLPEAERSEWIAIHKIRDSMLKHPKMVQAFFTEEFMGKLKETFETKWSDFDQRIQALEESVYNAIHDSSDEVKGFLETDFNPRLGQAIQLLRTAHTEALEKNQELESQCEEVTVRLEKREEELVDLQAAHAKTLENTATLEERLSQFLISHTNEMEADAKKRIERLDGAITYAKEKEAEADKKMAEADKKMAEAARKEAEADKKMAEADKKMAEAAGKEAEADKKMAEAAKMAVDAEKMIVAAQRESDAAVGD